MLLKKNIVLVFILTFSFGRIFSNKDEILDAINEKDHKKIASIVNNYKNLAKKKKEYLARVGDDLQKQDYMSFKFKQDNFYSMLRSFSYLGLSITSFVGAKKAFCGPDKYKKTGTSLGAAALFLLFQACNEFISAFNNSKDMSDYYKILAIREELLKA